MPKIKPTAQLIEDLVIRVPEGFIHTTTLGERLKLHHHNREQFQKAVISGKVGQTHEYYFDAQRLTAERVHDISRWCRPEFPPIANNQRFLDAPIAERMAIRELRLQESPHPTVRVLMALFSHSDGYMQADALMQQPNGEEALKLLIQDKFLKHVGTINEPGCLIYDPLRLGYRSARNVWEWYRIQPLHEQTRQWLAEQPGAVIQQTILAQRVGGLKVLDQLVTLGGFVMFALPHVKGTVIRWVRTADSDPSLADKTAKQHMKALKASADAREDQAWAGCLALCGDLMREGARDGKRPKMQVIARTYRVAAAAKALGVREPTLRAAVQADILPMFTDPLKTERIRADLIENALADENYLEQIAAFEVIKAKQIALVSGVTYSTARGRLKRAGLSTIEPTWGEVRGKWGLPETLDEFKATFKTRHLEWREAQEAKRRAEEEAWRLRLQEEREREKRERIELRAKLLAAFPTWRHDGRINQKIYLHVGPTNSGKTYDALQRLMSIGTGWYLAPLRLLAFEIFDTLNERGVPCNLLTGEEHVEVEGASITAATIEMFDPMRSGQCIIIDEAHMLADSDRGWAWTRALMEAQAPEIHVIGSPTVETLVERLASAAAVPVEVVRHERLTPLSVADHPWSLSGMPAKTILVAFSRRSVLMLKEELEKRRRRISVVYGNLPPEVRRRQAERFANGETEICVATDAVGMGLNLPADQVCFYEVEKFNGREVRSLTATEIQQIGGRAGRFGLSNGGKVGATTRHDLDYVAEMFMQPQEPLTHARVAPTVQDLMLIPGTLAERLEKWASLESIPESLRGAIKTADMTERIELAQMLSEKEVDQLGLANAMKLVNAPTRQSTRPYWRHCVAALLKSYPLPMPPEPSSRIYTHDDLEWVETCVHCADIYLWLANRREFAGFAYDLDRVRISRVRWSGWIDDALVRKPNATPKGSDRCPICRAVVRSAGEARLAHWKAAHPDSTDLTITYAAWIFGDTREDFGSRVRYDYRVKDGKNNIRYWKLGTLEKALVR